MCTSSLTKPTKPNAENEKTIASSFSYFLMLSSTNWKLSLSVNLNDAYNLATIVCFVPPPLPSTPPPSSFSSAFSFSLFFLHPPPFLAFVHFSETMAALVRLDKSSGARERHEFFFVSPVKIVLTLKMNDMETFVEMQTCEVLEAGWECDSKRENQICLRLHFPTLHETLKCGRDADKVTIKLTKRSDSGQAVLAVAVSDKSLAQVLTSQECAVTVSQEALEEAKNQQIPTCPWNLKFFNGRKVEHVLDIMQKIGASVIRWTASRSAAVASQPTGSDVQFDRRFARRRHDFSRLPTNLLSRRWCQEQILRPLLHPSHSTTFCRFSSSATVSAPTVCEQFDWKGLQGLLDLVLFQRRRHGLLGLPQALPPRAQ
eukprot:GHVT01089732.1.p1 GENE.GHVT01089732.1~~GHVT01089732.1.p1  ORF type:complete len:372 (+),score=72.69 GHVT01089732.1:453-1568(+)